MLYSPSHISRQGSTCAPAGTNRLDFRSPVPVPLWGDHGRGSQVSAGSLSPPGIYLVQTDWNILPLTVFNMADAFSSEVSASAPLAEVRLFKALPFQPGTPLSEGAA
eukprot:1339497-Rhodomonas_salina.1